MVEKVIISPLRLQRTGVEILADTNMTQSKKEDLIVALFAYVARSYDSCNDGECSLRIQMEDKLTDLIGIFSCEF